MKPKPNDILYRVLKNGFLFAIGTFDSEGRLSRLDQEEASSWYVRRVAYEAALDTAICGQTPAFVDDNHFFRVTDSQLYGQEVILKDVVIWNVSPDTKQPEAFLWPKCEEKISLFVLHPLSTELWGNNIPFYEDTEEREIPHFRKRMLCGED